MSFRLEPFSEQDQVSGQDVIDLWTRERAVDPAEIERRVAEVLIVATDEHGTLAGICSVFLKRNDQLRCELWHARGYVARAHRRSGLGLELGLAANEQLRRRFASGEDQRAIGILYEVEREDLKQISDAVWLPLDFTFIGVNARGDHLRVQYFPGALAPGPDGLPLAAPQGSA